MVLVVSNATTFLCVNCVSDWPVSFTKHKIFHTPRLGSISPFSFSFAAFYFYPAACTNSFFEMRVISVTTGKETGAGVLKTTANTDSLEEAEGAEAEATGSAHQ